MKVYIEIVILDNFIITFYIVKCVYFIIRRKEKLWRALLGSAVGTVVAVFYPFITSTVLSLLIKLMLYCILSTIFFAGKEQFFLASGLFLLVTVCFGGIVFALSFITSGNVIDALTKNYYSFPLSIVILGVVLGYKFFKIISKDLGKMSQKFKYGSEFLITIDGKSIKMQGFIDTGNTAIDSVSGLPIVLMSIRSLLKVISREKLIKVLSGNCGYSSEIITATGREKIPLIKPEKFVLYLDGQANRIVEVMIGVSIAKLNYDALLHSSFLDFGEKVC